MADRKDILNESDAAMKRMDQLVQQLVGELKPSSEPSWQEAVQDFAACAAQLDTLLSRHMTRDTPRTPEQLQKGIEALETELASKDELLKHAHEQVTKWQQICSDLQKQHEASLFQGMS